MQKKFLFFSMMIGLSLNGMSQEEYRAYLLRVLRKGGARHFTPLQERYAHDQEQFLDDVEEETLNADQFKEVATLFVVAPEMDTDCYMHGFDVRAQAMKKLKRRVAGKAQYQEVFTALAERFDQESMLLVRVALGVPELAVVETVFHELPHLVNYPTYYYQGNYDFARGTLLDYIEYEQKEEFSPERQAVLDDAKKIIVSYGGKATRNWVDE